MAGRRLGAMAGMVATTVRGATMAIMVGIHLFILGVVAIARQLTIASMPIVTSKVRHPLVMVSDVPAVAVTEVALAIRVPQITAVRRHRTEPLVPREAAVLALALAIAPAAVAAVPLAAHALVALAVVAVVEAPLAVAHALVAVVVALADKRYVTPNLNPL